GFSADDAALFGPAVGPRRAEKAKPSSAGGARWPVAPPGFILRDRSTTHGIIPMTDLIKTALDAGVLHIELNRPEAKNALTTEMYRALVAIFARARDDDGVRVVLFKGGRGCFCAGNDIGDFLEQPVLSEGSPVLNFLHELADFDKPLIAAVAGPAIGVATTFLLHCDLVYATESAVFSLPFVNLGISPEAASTYLLPRQLGYPRAAELLLLGERFNAARALELGLINGVVGEETYWEHATTQA